MTDNKPLFLYDALRRERAPLLCGVDEAGRGPLAGPVCCAAIVLPPDFYHPRLQDSKKMSEKSREDLFPLLLENALAFRIAWVSAADIDRYNILGATLRGMSQAVYGLAVKPDFVLVDGNQMPGIALPAETLIGGDGLSASVAAASVLAKVARDRYMRHMAKCYPAYSFEVHKGYPTKAHYQALAENGACPLHRKTFLRKWRDATGNSYGAL